MSEHSKKVNRGGLKPEDFQEIRKLYELGFSLREIAHKFFVSRGRIQHIVIGISKKVTTSNPPTSV